MDRRNILKVTGMLAAAGAGSGMFSSSTAQQKSVSKERQGDHDVPRKNTPLPWRERHYPFEKRKVGKVWPNGARMAFITYTALEQWDWSSTRITAMTGQEARRSTNLGKTPLDTMTSIKFGGDIGLRRMRDILRELNIKITLLTCGSYAEDFPEITKELADLGHEVNGHTYSYSTATVDLTREQQLEDIRKTVQLLKGITGQKPVGWLSQGASCDENTVELLAQEGFLYHCDLQDDDLPYFIDVGGKTLVEIPYRMVGNINDHRMFGRIQRPVGESLAFVKGAFDAYYEGAKKTPVHMIFGTHPFVSGRIDAAYVYAEFLKYVKSHPDVWIATYKGVAEWWMKQFNKGYPA